MIASGLPIPFWAIHEGQPRPVVCARSSLGKNKGLCPQPGCEATAPEGSVRYTAQDTVDLSGLDWPSHLDQSLPARGSLRESA